MDPLMLEDFGQRVDLTRRIREVLANYPEGTTVLKELIQNADDAGATRVRLCLDLRSHPRSSLLSPKLGEWQGPALLAYNDAVFTEDDFVSISRIGGSQKQGHAWKTGRFGVGFNSVYHLTDLPSFVSGKYVVIFDPQGDYLPNVSSANPGKRLEFVSSSAISVYKDQFYPYCAFGCDMRSPFDGTLFRFPLRNANQASVSKLSGQVYTKDDISSMLEQLYREAVFALLFLKNVLSVEMFVWDENGEAPRKLYSCLVDSSNENIVWHRQALLRLSKSAMCQETVMDSFTITFLSENLFGPCTERRSDTFLVAQTMASATSRIGSFVAGAAAKEFDLHLLPWASVAACISENTTEQVDVLKQGRAFCFLPLPVKTGLYVQVNAYFELSSNRRSIWYGEDMDRSGKLRSVWNRLLLEDVVAPTYNRLLLDLCTNLVDHCLCYSLWPRGYFEEPWNIVVEKLYVNICDSPVLYSDVDGGKWIPPVEAFFQDENFDKSKELVEILVFLGMPVVVIPDFIVEMLLKHVSTMSERVLQPTTVRNHLKDCITKSKLSKDQKLLLLEYCLQDLVDAEVGQRADNLPLLPLANGEYGSFSDFSTGLSYIICDESSYKMLLPIADQLIELEIPLHIRSRLTSISESSKTNVKLFNIQVFLGLLPRFFPSEWKFKNRVEWDPDSCKDHPTASWFSLFWKYIGMEFNTLALLGDWPILPSISGHLYRVSKHEKFINAEILPDGIQAVLRKIGCKVLDFKYGVQHPDLFNYVYGSDGAGVVDVISDIVSSNGSFFQESFFESLTGDERNELRLFLLDPKWYLGGSIKETHINKIKKLPIYLVYSGRSSRSFDFSDLESSKKWFPPSHTPEQFLCPEFIYSPCCSESDTLTRYFDIKPMSRSYFYNKKVINRISELQSEVRDPVMLTILKDLPQLCLEDLSIKESLRRLHFIPVNSGALKSPEVLYDPRNEELFTLLEGSDSFPCGAFQESLVLDMLLGLGLRTSISPDTIIQSARQIEYEMNKDPEKVSARGKLLLSYLEVNAAKWSVDRSNDYFRKMNRLFSKLTPSSYHDSSDYNLEKFWSDLKIISWCPVLVSPPHPSLPWPAVSSTVAPPKLVRLKADIWLVSGSLRILDAECSSSALSLIFGWSTSPGGSVIAAQLLELGKSSEMITDQVLRTELALVMPRIYCILSGMVGSDEMDVVKAVLEGSRWIWVGDGFATKEEVVLSGPLHLAPYIRVIPVDLAVFRNLFVELGVREVLGPGDYAGILGRMASCKRSSPLDTQELRAVILIVQHLAEVYIQDLNIQIYLPDLSRTLFPASDLVYNDAPWLLCHDDNANTLGSSSMIYLSGKGNIQKFVHGNISIDVADKLGVYSLRRLLLAESADSMNLSLSGSVEAFGQHEDLTTRLKHIVEMYADGPGILFELVQNADDAGASEVNFLLDKTQYGVSSLLSPEMAQWQGPALYCFNNSTFSSHDLHAISRIGQDSKLEKPFAIGRFGLGFNCVYHFTDVPGFVSGENIVMFDPHAYHLPGISPSHPGLKIKFVGRKILDQFPDQFAPFLHFGCDLQNPLPGTLFRFPLRNGTAASRSQIKKEAYSSEDVEALFSSFAEVVSETLLFLRNVKTISLFTKDGAGSEMQLFHRVVRHNVNDYLDEPCKLHPALRVFHKNEKCELDRDQFLSQLMKKTSDHSLPWNCEKVLVLEQNYSYNCLHLWMISECLNSAQEKNKLLATEKKSNSIIPYASVAAYLHCFNMDDVSEESTIDDHAANENVKSLVLNHSQVPKDSSTLRKTIEGRGFCFLPLPICTGLPAHINAYFELSSNRRDIWFGSDMAGGGKVRSDWNMYLLEDVVPPAYGHMLEKVALELGPDVSYFSLWPTSLLVEPWTTMVRKFYRCVADLHLRVLFTKAREGQWITPKQALFPDFSFPRSNELVEALSDAGLPLAVVSESVEKRFMEVCPMLNFLKPQLLRNLLKRRTREFKCRNDMLVTLEYCLSDITESIPCDALCGLPLVPLANGLFTSFSKQGEGERIFVASLIEYELLKDAVPNLIVDHSIPHSILKNLKFVAESGNLNLCLMSCYFMEELLPRFFPSEWLLSERVTWNPQHSKQPNSDWMSLFWSYLKSVCVDLSLFHKWPILPIQDGHLTRLVKNSNVFRNDGWSENMLSLLKKMGCYLLAVDFQIDHPQLNVYVQDATATGILNALLNYANHGHDVEKLFSDATEGEIHELRSFIFQLKWFQSGQMEASHFEMIRCLPIFETYRSRQMKSLINPVKMLPPMGALEDLLDENFVRTESERASDILRTFLRIREPSMFEFYENFVLNNMYLYLSQPVTLLAILQCVKSLTQENTSLTSVLALTPFVQAADGSWKPPSRLYDPRVPGFRELLHRKAFFPNDEFISDTALEILISVGLRKTLDYTGLLDSARSVSLLNDSGDSDAFIYARKLFVCLDFISSKFSLVDEGAKVEDIVLERANYAEMVTSAVPCKSLGDIQLESFLGGEFNDEPEDEFWIELRGIEWCPVYADPPVKGLPWSSHKQLVASPNAVRPLSQMWMVSSIMYVLDCECDSRYLQFKLGWIDSPSVSILSNQLVEISKFYSQLTLEDEIVLFSSSLKSELTGLYSMLQDFVDTDGFSILKSTLKDVSCIWIGDNFVPPTSLAFDSPVKFAPYLYVVPSELSEFRNLLLALGVKMAFDAVDYIHVLKCLQQDLGGLSLSSEQLDFVLCILEAVADCATDLSGVSHLRSLLIPDVSGHLLCAEDLIYNDAPWMEKNAPIARSFVHPIVSIELANKLGVQSLRCLSLVDEELTKDLPCMDFARISELLTSYGGEEFLLFDLLELADCCKATKVHLLLDKRQHSKRTLLQHNFGEFQGPALTVVLEGTSLSLEEVYSLQFLPPWKLRGATLSYGLGMLSCYCISHFLAVASNGNFYVFDPCGKALSAVPSSQGPAAKMFSLMGTDLVERFDDQFQPMLIKEKNPWFSSNSTVIRMPLSSECLKEGHDSGYERLQHLLGKFTAKASKTLLFLKSVFQVTLLTWGDGDLQPSQDYSICVDPLSVVMRNPFSEKKWRKFQISRLFGGSNAAIKLHVIDIHVFQGGMETVEKWLVVLSLGSGQTRNMALDRRYVAYNLTPVGGIAALISINGKPGPIESTNSILAPFPLSICIAIPVVVLGYFLVCHNGRRCLFDHHKHHNGDESSSLKATNVGNQLIEAWNKELMCCVRDSYIEMLVELNKLQREPLSSTLKPNARLAIGSLLQVHGGCIYSFWPKSKPSLPSPELSYDGLNSSSLPFVFDADWKCFIEQVVRPLYAGLVTQPVWQLYNGKWVKADEGMFLSYSTNDDSANLPPATVCNFVKEHYPVFSVPRELVTEIQAVGAIVTEIRPKMVRDLLKASSSSVILRSVETYADILDYCLTDIQVGTQNDLQHNGPSARSNIVAYESREPREGFPRITIPRASYVYTAQIQRSPHQDSEPLDIMSNLGRALFDFGRGVMEDIGRAGDSLINLSTTEGHDVDANRLLEPILSELRGLPCPTATMRLARLGVTDLWIGSKEEQSLMIHLAAMFMHSECLGRESVEAIFSSPAICKSLKIQKFSPTLLSNHMKQLFSEQWVTNVMNLNSVPWVSWDCNMPDGGPSKEWIQLFFQAFGGSQCIDLFSDWPLIPGFLGRSVLCRVRIQELVFIPPITNSDLEIRTSSLNETGSSTTESDLMQSYLLAFEKTKCKHPWLLPLLNQCNIPVYDSSFLVYGTPKKCLPSVGQSLGQVIISKVLSAKCNGYFPERVIFSDEVCNEIFSLFAMDFDSFSGLIYSREALDVLCTLPIYKTVVGTYVCLHDQNRCIISPSSFFKPFDERCLSFPVDSEKASLLHALGVSELHNQEILWRFALPHFEEKSQSEKEDILLYIYMNWQDLQTDSVISALKETKFVRSTDVISRDLYKPQDLFDPCDPLLASVFCGDKARFPSERFSGDGWIHILRKTGLRTSLEPDVMLECAKKVALLGSAENHMNDSDALDPYFSEIQAGVELDVWNMAMSVTDTIFKNLAVLYSNNFCNQVSKIAFVPSLKGFPTIGGKKGGRRVLASYEQAIMSADWPLAWSSAPILASQSVVPPEYTWAAFQLRSPPVFSTVLRHLQVMGINGGEDTLAHWPASTGMKSIEDASCDVLTYLDSVWGSLSAADKLELEKVSFIPVANGTRLVAAKSLFTRLTINLSPFSFELPSYCLPFLKILKDIGLQDVLSIAYAKELLLSIQKSRGYQRMNPNELRAVLEILSYICNDFAGGNVDESIDAMEAIVPDDGCRLVSAKSCVYIDTWGNKFVGNIDTSLLRFTHPDLSKKMCETLGIKKLSEVVIEELEHGQELEVLNQCGEVHLDMIKDKLKSECLHVSLWSVLKNLSDPSVSSEVVNFGQIQHHLKSMAEKMKFVRAIYTRFVLYPKVVDITLKKTSVVPGWSLASKNRTLHFIDRQRSVFLLAEPPSYISLFDIIAVVVSRSLGLSCVLPVGCLFSSPPGSEKEIINILKLGSKWINVGDGNVTNLIGRLLIPQDALQVQFHPLRPFYKGEIIAWRSKEDGDKLKYGCVQEDVRPSAGQALYRLKVETRSDEILHLLSSQVFSFKSNLSTNEGSTMQYSVPMHANRDTLLLTNDNDPAKSAFQVDNEIQPGRVSSAELVHAVYEMLSAAGINMDVEKKNLLQTALTLQEELRESQAALLLEQEKADIAAKEAESAKTAWMCRICLSAEIDTALTPCGHASCNRCSAAVSRCPFCRLKVTKLLRIFRP